jgi:hypothetical protein
MRNPTSLMSVACSTLDLAVVANLTDITRWRRGYPSQIDRATCEIEIAMRTNVCLVANFGKMIEVQKDKLEQTPKAIARPSFHFTDILVNG